jgi:hypothetical protein
MGTVPLTGCTIADNLPLNLNLSSSSATLSNCIVWGAPIRTDTGTTLTATYSDIQGNLPGLGNVDTDPLFANPGTGNYRLLPGSPCIDAGSNANVPADTADLDGDGNVTEPLPFDLAGAGRFADDPYAPDTGAGTVPIVDIGAYEHHLADATGDGHVDFVDLLKLVYSFGTLKGDAGFDPACDFNHDGAVDVVDLLDLVYRFGT